MREEVELSSEGIEEGRERAVDSGKEEVRRGREEVQSTEGVDLVVVVKKESVRERHLVGVSFCSIFKLQIHIHLHTLFPFFSSLPTLPFPSLPLSGAVCYHTCYV